MLDLTIEHKRKRGFSGMKKLLIIVIEGCSLEYISLENTPNIYRIAKAGFCKCVKAAIPTINMVNHTTILTGKFPCDHHVTGNLTYNLQTGQLQEVNESGFVPMDTIMDVKHNLGASTALLSVSNQVLERFGRHVDFGVSVEKPKDILLNFLGISEPPAKESLLASLWILDACYRLLKKNSMDVVYCATNDYMMRHYGPDSQIALRHMRKIDEWLGKIFDLDHDREIYITGGYGINRKSSFIPLKKTLAEKGYPGIRTNPLYKDVYETENHQVVAGIQTIYVDEMDQIRSLELLHTLEELDFVDVVSTKEEAMKRFNLPGESVGDFVVFAAEGYAFLVDETSNEMPAIEEKEEEIGDFIRTNGSLQERAVPLIAVNAKEVAEKYRYSRDIVKILMEE